MVVLLINSDSLFVDFFGFSTYVIMPSIISDSFISSFSALVLYFLVLLPWLGPAIQF